MLKGVRKNKLYYCQGNTMVEIARQQQLLQVARKTMMQRSCGICDSNKLAKCLCKFLQSDDFEQHEDLQT